jgi:hypothetical protein
VSVPPLFLGGATLFFELVPSWARDTQATASRHTMQAGASELSCGILGAKFANRLEMCAIAEPLLAKPPNESELRVDLVNGSMIRLYGADNPDALRGPYLDGVVLDEFADMKPEVWYEVVRPMLADRKGWATFIGTPKGKNEFWKIYNDAKKDPAWFHMMLKASESGISAPSELTDLRREMGEDQYQQEFECSFEAAIKGAFYAEEMRTMLAEGRICPIEINKDVKTHTAWDLGGDLVHSVCRSGTPTGRLLRSLWCRP